MAVSVDTSQPSVENDEIKRYLDQSLLEHKKHSIDTVANTIFPMSLWNPQSPRQQLYEWYKLAWSRIKSHKDNSSGTYFNRMIAFEGGNEPVNQLEHIITKWNEGMRRHSAFQMSIFSPLTDHTNSPYGKFPCLHQICVTPHGSHGKDGIAVTGFYATQILYNKAYGNYLGLMNLGKFLAHEMNLKLVNVTCITAKPETCLGGRFDKSQLRKMAVDLEAMLPESEDLKETTDYD